MANPATITVTIKHTDRGYVIHRLTKRGVVRTVVPPKQ